MFEGAILSLAHKPDEDLFIRVLFSLVVRQVEGIAGLLVESSQRICRVYETVLEGGEMGLGRGSPDQSLGMDLLALRHTLSRRVQWHVLRGCLRKWLLIVDLSTHCSKSVHAQRSR